MAKPRSSRSKRPSKRTTTAKALRTKARAEDILKQDEAYRQPKKRRRKEKGAREAPPAARRLEHPLEVAAQHWMQAAMLPWAGWTALGTMMLNWPLMQMPFGALQRPDEKRNARTRS